MENKDKMKRQACDYVSAAIDKADKDGNLEHFEIEISNHQGNLQMNTILKTRKKVY